MNPMYARILSLLEGDKEVAVLDLMNAINDNLEDDTEKYKPPAFLRIINGMEKAGLIGVRDGTVPGTAVPMKYIKKSGEEGILTGVYVVFHGAFSTDDIRPTTSLVTGVSPEEALQKYNALAKKRKDYPHMWNEVGPDSIKPATAIL